MIKSSVTTTMYENSIIENEYIFQAYGSNGTIGSGASSTVAIAQHEDPRYKIKFTSTKFKQYN
jgi:hypothetical protein